LEPGKVHAKSKHLVNYQHRFAAHLDEPVDGEAGKRVTGLRNLWVNLLQFGLDSAAGS
jgi:hypothetical protein